MTSDNNQRLIALLKVMADESRLRILGILVDREASVEELAAFLGLKTPTVSHHLHRLREQQLVEMRAEGTAHYFKFRPETLLHLNRDLLTPEKLASIADVDGDLWERKVLRDFLNGLELKEIPASHKKRLIILKWLVRDFDMGVRYTEAEVNARIQVHHPDFATLRREFIGNRLMAREDGVYWRI